MYYDPTFLLLIPAMLFAFYAQMKVGSTFKKYQTVFNRRGLTGAEVAEQLLYNAGITDITVEHVKGNLTDHYDPRSRTLRLSDAVYNNKSVAALGVAAHETGHAMQHNEGYAALSIRNSIFPVVNIGSHMSMPLIIIGLVIAGMADFGSLGMIIVDIGIVLFSLVVLFQLITLPVEFNASNRAIYMLESDGILDSDEIYPAKKVLSAAAMTYVAAAAVAVLNLIRLLMIANRRD